MSRGDDPFIADGGGSASMDNSPEMQLIGMLPYVSCCASHDPGGKEGRRSHQEGCYNIKSGGEICLGRISKKVAGRYVNHARIRSTLLLARPLENRRTRERHGLKKCESFLVPI